MQLWDLYCKEIPDFLAEACEAAAMLRLRDVGMNCGCEYTAFPLFSGIAPYSRYDHSVGVALIVWNFTHDKAQTLSGLYHDISTPVFAHVIDFLHGDHLKQESTEQATAEIIRNQPDILATLQKNKLSVFDVEDYHRYPIADNDAPKLSADRLEYTLGNAINYGILTRAQAANCYADLTIGQNEFHEDELMFQSPETALTFANAALACSEIYVSDQDRYAMQYLAELLKQAIDEGILTESDLYLREKTIISKLRTSPLCGRWEEFRALHQIIRKVTPDADGFWRQIPAKKRYIDPYIADIGRVSAQHPQFEEKLKIFLNTSQAIWLCGK